MLKTLHVRYYCALPFCVLSVYSADAINGHNASKQYVQRQLYDLHLSLAKLQKKLKQPVPPGRVKERKQTFEAIPERKRFKKLPLEEKKREWEKAVMEQVKNQRDFTYAQKQRISHFLHNDFDKRDIDEYAQQNKPPNNNEEAVRSLAQQVVQEWEHKEQELREALRRESEEDRHKTMSEQISERLEGRTLNTSESLWANIHAPTNIKSFIDKEALKEQQVNLADDNVAIGAEIVQYARNENIENLSRATKEWARNNNVLDEDVEDED